MERDIKHWNKAVVVSPFLEGFRKHVDVIPVVEWWTWWWCCTDAWTQKLFPSLNSMILWLRRLPVCQHGLWRWHNPAQDIQSHPTKLPAHTCTLHPSSHLLLHHTFLPQFSQEQLHGWGDKSGCVMGNWKYTQDLIFFLLSYERKKKSTTKSPGNVICPVVCCLTVAQAEQFQQVLDATK